ncbi:MAG: hypothetical protein ACI9TY_001095 [Alphaproteobacteria bacterium]|jgi:hypothetical protein
MLLFYRYFFKRGKKTVFLHVAYCVFAARLALYEKLYYDGVMKIYIFISLLALSLIKGSLSIASDWQKQGERLTFDVKWSFMSVGQAELLFRPQGDNYHIIGRAWTGDGMNAVYNLRDRIQIKGALQDSRYAFLTNDYMANLHENDYRAHKTVFYDRDDLKATYTNVHAGHKSIVSNIESESRDMISALYYLRGLNKNLELGDVYKLPIFELDKPYTLHMNVQKKEMLDTVLGKVETFQIQPILKNLKGENKKKKDRLSIWVTADGQFIPVKIEIALRFGSFRAILSQYAAMDSASNAPSYLPETGLIEIAEEKTMSYGQLMAD